MCCVQTALADTFSLPSSLSASAPNLRTLLLSGDFFLGGVIAGEHTPVPPVQDRFISSSCVRWLGWQCDQLPSGHEP